MKLEMHFKDDNGNDLPKISSILTTEHPQSSYGMPVLLIMGGVYGAGDTIPVIGSAAKWVSGWVAQHPENIDGVKLCNRFLSAIQ